VAFIEAAKEWSKREVEGEKLVTQMEEKVKAKNWDDDFNMYKYQLESRYGYDSYDYKDEKPDYSRNAAYFFNPYHSISSIYIYLHGRDIGANYKNSPEFEKFSLLNRTEYKIPFYNINRDFTTNHVLAKKYYDAIKAPRKQYYTMKNMAHGLLEIRSDEFSDIVHDIAKLEQTNTTIAIN